MMPGFEAVTAMLKARSGIVIGADKLYLIDTRLAPIIKREGCRDLAELAGRLRPNGALERDVVEAMTTNESLFFRDGKPFEALRLRVLPRLHAQRPAGAPIRIWSAAASTGQEAYSIAMIAAEQANAMPGRRIEILGTDIAREPLMRAREGLYSQFEIQRGLPMQMLVRHFTKEEAQWRIKPALRAAVTFREANLLADLAPLGRFDVVFCRNVLIYFDTETKRTVLAAIARQLAPDGVLFLGGAETVLGLTDQFKPIASESGAYGPDRPAS
jgi:chemotaxis protein methyltransferase CheR